MQIYGATKFERLFRLVAELDVDKEDHKRLVDFLNERIRDLLIRAQAVAHANGRDVIEAIDLPITKGLQERIQEFLSLESELDLTRILDELVNRPPLDLALSDDADVQLPRIAGGLTVALGRMFKVVEPDLKNPQTRHWDLSFRIFELLL